MWIIENDNRITQLAFICHHGNLRTVTQYFLTSSDLIQNMSVWEETSLYHGFNPSLSFSQNCQTNGCETDKNHQRNKMILIY